MNKLSFSAQSLGVTKLATARDIVLVTLCCGTQVQLRRSTKPLMPQFLHNFSFHSTTSDALVTYPLCLLDSWVAIVSQQNNRHFR
jgi:hypothetical protein